MRFVLEESVFGSRDQTTTRQLIEIWLKASNRQHDVLVAPGAETSWSRWLGEQTELQQEIFQTAHHSSQRSQATYPSDSEFWVGHRDTSDWDHEPPMLTIGDALWLMRRPFKIMVEDAISDAQFLNRCVPRPLRSAWRAALSLERLEFAHCGGKTQVARRLRGGEGRPPRSKQLWVVIDSDAPKPWLDSERPRHESWSNLPEPNRDAAESARKHGVSVRVLDRRMAENYIPPAALRKWAQGLKPTEKDKVGHVERFCELPPARQYHHSLKTGIRKSEEYLYAELSAVELDDLRGGLGRFVGEALDFATDTELDDYRVFEELSPLYQRILKAI